GALQAGLSGGHRGLRDHRDADSANDGRTHHDDAHPAHVRSVDADVHPVVPGEQAGDVTLADGVDGIQVTGDAPDQRDLPIYGGMHAMVIARREVDDGEVPAAIARRIAPIARQLAHVVGLAFDEDPSARIDGAMARQPAVRRADDRGVVDRTGARAKTSGEERIEADVRARFRRGLLQVDAIGSAVGALHEPRHRPRQWRLTEVTYGATDPDPGEGADELCGSERRYTHAETLANYVGSAS